MIWMLKLISMSFLALSIFSVLGGMLFAGIGLSNEERTSVASILATVVVLVVSMVPAGLFYFLHSKLRKKVAGTPKLLQNINPPIGRKNTKYKLQILISLTGYTLSIISVWSCPGLVPVTCLIYAATLSKARGLLPPNVECLRRGL